MEVKGYGPVRKKVVAEHFNISPSLSLSVLPVGLILSAGLRAAHVVLVTPALQEFPAWLFTISNVK